MPWEEGGHSSKHLPTMTHQHLLTLQEEINPRHSVEIDDLAIKANSTLDLSIVDQDVLPLTSGGIAKETQ